MTGTRVTLILALVGVCALWLVQPQVLRSGQRTVDDINTGRDMCSLAPMSPSGSELSGGLFEATSVALIASNAETIDRATRARASETYGKLPLQFEANQGQTGDKVKFVSRGSGYTLFLTSSEAVLALRKGQREDSAETGSPAVESKAVEDTGGTVLRLKLVGVSTSPQVRGLDELSGRVNYFVGSDPANWRTNVPTYGKVHYKDVYPGIDLVYYGSQRQLEYDFVVAPGGDPRAIRLAFEGADTVRLDDDGGLILYSAGGEVVLKAPIIYQDVDGVRRNISGSYVLEGESRVAFQVAAYDRGRPLIIDPVLVYSTYLGGGNSQSASGIAVDSSGNAYVTGTTMSSNFPTVNPIQGAKVGFSDVFVTKFSTTGSALIYSTYLGGSNSENGRGIAVDSSGNAYVTGETGSPDFPIANAVQGAHAGGIGDAFMAKLNAAGSALLYSTYLGGSGSGTVDRAYGIAVDSSGNAYVTGMTESSDFPTVNPIQGAKAGSSDVFVTKLSSTGSALVYSTYLGGSAGDNGLGIAVDSPGNAYVTGETGSSDFPTANPIQGAYAGGSGDAFMAKLNVAGSALLYSTYLGGSGNESGQGIAVDSASNAYVTGWTYSSDFPTANPVQGANAGGEDVFVTKLNTAGSALLYSTYLGGSGTESGQGIAVDSSSNAYVTGQTHSSDFPTVNPIQGTNPHFNAVFVTKFSTTGSALVYSTYLHGNTSEWGAGIAVDSAGGAYVTGATGSTNFPTVNPFQAARAGTLDAFVAKIQTECQVDADCDAGNLCTTEVCAPGDPAANAAGCVFTNNSSPCDDGDACTVGDLCSGGVCVSGPPPNCDDANVCTDDSCDSGSGCVNTPNTDFCDDGEPCTVDVCEGGSCVGTLDASACIDRFLCYKTKARQEIEVPLTDEFDSGTYRGKAAKLLCKPADMNGEGIMDEDTHLMAYKIKGPHLRRTSIEVEDEFGTFFYDTKKADTLMVPTAQSGIGDPPPGPPDPGSLVDHYRCLKVRTAKGTTKFPKELKRPSRLVVDQFGSRKVYLRKPYKLCLPVNKDVEGIKNPGAHLLCYKIKAEPRRSRNGIQVNNQFHQTVVDLKKETELCVPSLRKPATSTTTSTTTTSTTTTVP